MNRLILLLVLISIFSLSSFSQTTKRVLFLGNSYTASHNLPIITAELASSAGDELFFDSNTPGGYTLQGHSTNLTTLEKIQQGNWDYVVLQEQSQLPSFPIAQVEEQVFPFASQLNDSIKHYNFCGETMFFMTWGRKNGDASNCAVWPPICTYEGMDDLLRERYMIMAEDNDAVVSPVGAVWRYIRENHPDIELYTPDESHPSLAGSYAAACCFYTAIFRKDPELITDDYSIPENDAAFIRAAVKTVVYDNMEEWFIGAYDPIADFDFEVTDIKTVSFNNLSDNASDYIWDFGDGNNSTEMHPAHTYVEEGLYIVNLVALHCDYADTIHTPILIGTTINENHDNNKLEIFPNPGFDKFTIMTQNIEAISFYNSAGQRVYPTKVQNGNSILTDFSGLPTGMYFVSVIKNSKTVTQKIIRK